jgi:LuxR family maltose regulon positive regulatory protein
LARIYFAQKHLIKAEHEILESMKSLGQLDVPHWVESFVISLQVHYFLKIGDFNQGEIILSERNLPIPYRFYYPNETEYLVYARWLSNQNKTDQAIDILEQLDEWLISIDWINLALEVKLVWAKVLFSIGYNKEALDKLKSAVKLAHTEGYCRSFLDEYEPIEALLKEAKKQNIYPEYCSTLLFDSKNTAQAIAYDNCTEPLSRRELHVLKLLNTQMTSSEIAREIFVSVNTIKTHIKHIYSKLNVHTRKEAIQKATEMHII